MLRNIPDDDQLMSLVSLALGKPGAERQRFLREACGGDTELFRQAWSYVQWDERMGDFMKEPLFAPPRIEHRFNLGELLVGRFRIKREIA
jgi:hypothetical protein